MGEPAAENGAVLPFENRIDKAWDLFWKIFKVSVLDHDHSTRGVGKRLSYRGTLPGRSGVVDDRDLFAERIEFSTGLVGAAVIDDDNLLGQRHSEDALHNFADRSFLVLGRNKNRDVGRTCFGHADGQRIPGPAYTSPAMAETFDLVLKGGTLVSGERTEKADIGIRGGKIVLVGPIDAGSAAESVDLTGLHVLPGVIDSQVHFREPGLTHKEDLESGSRAAVMGGVTTFFDEPNVEPTTTTRENLFAKIKLAEGRCWANYAFWVGASNENLDELGELEMLPGTPGIGEVFMGSSTGPLLVSDDDSLRKVLKNGQMRVAIHAEDEYRLIARKALLSSEPHVREHPFLRDPESSRLATERILRLSAETRRAVHVLHVSTADEIPLLREAKKSGLGTTCEITPQHLTFNADDYESLGTKIQMNTPIRDEPHRLALWEAVQDGLFDVFGSDHAPHTLAEKAKPYPASPSGMPGVQTMLPVMLDWCAKGEISLQQIVRMTAENPARLFGVGDKGFLVEGYDADLAIVDLSATFEVTETWLQSKCGWSPYEGRRLTGKSIHTLVRGGFAVRDSNLLLAGLGRVVEFGWK